MRLWSIHPKYLDAKGLVAAWREGLLAKHVLEGKTKGYKYHPQLIRFRNSNNAVDSINQYLCGIYEESLIRNYKFDRSKLSDIKCAIRLPVTTKQIKYEFTLLKNKLHRRDLIKFNEIKHVKLVESHSMFTCVDGEIESWEKVINQIGDKNEY
jgi:hypothetical protein